MSKKFNLICQSCNSHFHFTTDCPRISYNINKNILYIKINQQKMQKRQFVIRRKVKKERKIKQDKKNKKTIVSSKSIVISHSHRHSFQLNHSSSFIKNEDNIDKFIPKNSAIITKEALNSLFEIFQNKRRENMVNLSVESQIFDEDSYFLKKNRDFGGISKKKKNFSLTSAKPSHNFNDYSKFRPKIESKFSISSINSSGAEDKRKKSFIFF